MKKTLLLCVLVAVCFSPISSTRAADDPGDKFLEAYFLIQEGDAAERQSDWVKAEAKFKGADEILGEIKSQSPDWNPHIIEFRTKYVEDHIAALKAKSAAPAPAEPQTAPPAAETPAKSTVAPAAPTPAPVPTVQVAPAAPTPAAPSAPAPSPAAPEAAAPVVAPIPVPPVSAADSEQVKQLTAELQRAHDQIQQLESARNDLNTKLQEQLNKVAPTETNPQIEELLKANQDLAAKLAAAQTQVAEARERAAATTAAPVAATAAEQSEIAQLKTDLEAARGELQHTKDELQQTRVELGATKQALEKSQADNVALRQSYDEVIAQLTDANKKLTSAKASSDKDDEIIRQLRKENALLRIIAERKSNTSISPAEAEENPNGPSIPELRGWRPHTRPTTAPKSQPTLQEAKAQPQTPPSAVEESGSGKLVATLTAPKKVEPAPQPVATPPAKTQTNAPAKPVKATPPPPTPQPAPQPKKETVTTPAPVPVPVPTPTVVEKTDPAPAPDERQLLNEARAAMALKDFNTAATKYEAVLAMNQTNIAALAGLGNVRYQQGRLDDAEQNLRKAVAAAPNDSATRSLLGVVFYRKGLTEDAFNELTRATALDPRNAEAHNYLGIVLSQKGWSAAGEQEIRRAIDLDPQYADAHFNLAVIYAKQRTPNLELARYHYKKALDLGAPPDADLEALLKKLTDKAAAPNESAAPRQ